MERNNQTYQLSSGGAADCYVTKKLNLDTIKKTSSGGAAYFIGYIYRYK